MDCRDMLAMGLVNPVVPHDQLDAEVQRWCDEIRQRSPTAFQKKRAPDFRRLAR
jgi:1,4-dihydroxy-2-naphthoyl-CoA synthase